MKNLVLLFVLLLSNAMFAQKDMSEIAKMFEQSDYADIYLKDSQDASLKLEYYLKDGVLYKKENDVLKSIALSNIDFTKEFIYENALDVVTNTKKSPFEMSISSLKPKKIPGLSFSFEFKEEAQLAFQYLKTKAENPTNELRLSPTFITQLSEIICHAENDFDSIKVYSSDKKLSASLKSKIQLEGGLVTKIYSSTVEVDFGNFENEVAASLAYEKLLSSINGTKPKCASIFSISPNVKDDVLINKMCIWSSSEFSKKQSVLLALKKFENVIKLSIIINYEGDDEDEGW